jgi:transposase, IS6 family
MANAGPWAIATPCFKSSGGRSTTIAGIELMNRIRKGQFDLDKLRINNHSAPHLWNAVLAA